MFKVALLAFAALAAIASADRKVLFERAAHPKSWTKGAVAAGDAPLKFSVALRHSDYEGFDRRFNEITDPQHPDYTKWMTREEIMEYLRTPLNEYAAVDSYFSLYDIKCDFTGDSLLCSGNVDQVSRAFETTFHEFTHTEKDVTIIRHVGPISVPESIHEYVELVTGLGHFPVPKYGVAYKSNSNDQDFWVVPQTISNMYNIGNAKGSSKSIQSVAEFQGYGAYEPDDLTAFQKDVDIQFDVSTKVGPFSPGFQTAESTLDIEYVGAVGVGNDNWYWTTDYWMYEFSQQVFQRQKVPYVISMSYGWSEADQCEIDQEECSQLGVDSQGFVTRVNKEFQKIGARGVTLLASSGDSGAHGRTDKLCFSKVVHPTYPAGSPFVLAVGATQITGGTSGFSNVPICSQLTPGCAESGTEVVASTATGAMITSGGGFSVYAERPAWQKNAVDAYVNGPAAKPAKSDYNSAGRGYPDVAALGHKYYIQLDGESVGVDGTSASSPAFAGVIGLLNAYLLENGKNPLGFVNPLIYEMAAANPKTFNDVTQGDNKCTEATCDCADGFAATQGWDASTGFGTPNYGEMLKYVQQKFNLAPPSTKVLNAATSLRGAQQ